MVQNVFEPLEFDCTWPVVCHLFQYTNNPLKTFICGLPSLKMSLDLAVNDGRVTYFFLEKCRRSDENRPQSKCAEIYLKHKMEVYLLVEITMNELGDNCTQNCHLAR